MSIRRAARNVLRLIVVGSTTLLLAACYGAIDPHPYDDLDTGDDRTAAENIGAEDIGTEDSDAVNSGTAGPLEGLSLAEPGAAPDDSGNADSPLDAE